MSPSAERRPDTPPDPPDERAAPVEGPRAPAPPLALRVLALAALLVPATLVLLVQGPAPLLLREAPLVLLALHPFEPWSLLVASRTDPLPFVAVVVLARAVPCCGDYWVGRWYGTRALERLSHGRRAGRLARAVHRLSGRFGAVLLIVYPGATASVLAGTNAMPFRRFLPLMVTGITLAALLTRFVAAAASGPVAAVAAFVDRHVVLLGLALLAGVVLWQLLPRRGASDRQ